MALDPEPHELDLELLLCHRAWLRALAARLVGPGLADDLLQETWLAAVRHPPDPGRPARPWLATVARRLARGLRRPPALHGGDPEVEAPSTDELLEQVELEARLAREVARLAEPFRRTVLLRYHEGLSPAEIALQDGVPAGTVRWRLKRGLDELRGRLDKDFGDRKSWVALLAGLAGVEAGGGWLGLSTATKLAGAAGIAALLAAGGVAWIARPAAPALAARDARAPVELAAAQAPPGSTESGQVAALAGEGRRAAPRLTSSAEVQGAPGLHFEIAEWDGAPGADLLVALRPRGAPASEQPATARTDAAGRVAFPEAAGAVDVAVERRSAPPFLLALEADGAEHKLELPHGAVVAGRILVAGEPPKQPIALELLPESAGLPFKAPDPQPSLLFDGGAILRGTTDAGGAFAFAGLDAAWRGTLRVEPGYVLRGRARFVESFARRHTLTLSAPTEDIALDLERCPSLRGRVMDPTGREPVAHAGLMLYVTLPDGTTPGTGAAADAGGRFEVFLGQLELRSVYADYFAPDRVGRGARLLERAEISADGDLGDLLLAPGRQATLRVADTAGRPIAGALVGEQTPSDAEGELALAWLPLEETSVWVAARGYVGESVAVPENADVVDVVLELANELSIEVVDRDGEPLTTAHVDVSAEGPIFLTPHQWPEWLTGGEGEGRHESTVFKSLQGHRTHTLRTDARGRLTLTALQPGRELELDVRAGCHDSLAELRVEAPAAAQRRAVVLRVEQELLTLRARFVDQDAQTVAGVSLALRQPQDGPHHLESSRDTDSDGRVEIPNLLRVPYHLRVEKEGYLPLAIEPFRVPDGELELVLERGLDVVVRVRDTQGNPVAGGRIKCADLEGQTFREVEAGRIDLPGLPDRRLELALVLAGVTYTLQHDPRSGEATFVVPEHGSVAVSWAQPAGADWSEWLHVRLHPQDGTRAPLEASVYDLPTGEWSFPAIAPGLYEAVLDRGFAEEGVPPVELTQRARFEVHGGETLRVVLVPLP